VLYYAKFRISKKDIVLIVKQCVHDFFCENQVTNNMY